MILFENVGQNDVDHDKGPEQTPERFIRSWTVSAVLGRDVLRHRPTTGNTASRATGSARSDAAA